MNPHSDLAATQQLFISYLTERKRARATILAYTKDIDQLIQFLRDLGHKLPSEIVKDELTAFLSKLASDSYTPKSISRKINSIKTYYRFLKANQFIEQDIAANISHPKYEVKPPRILSKIEYRALRDACREDIRISAIVELFLQTGLRIGELANLIISDIHEDTLHISPQESHIERTVPLNKPAKASLKQYLTTRPKTEIPTLFVTKTGRPLLIRNIRTSIDRYFKLAGIDNARVNDLRHTFIAHHLMSGTPLTVISKLVGHKRISTTEKYLDFIKGRGDKGMRLEEL
jgi:site-specific recombinase XerD